MRFFQSDSGMAYKRSGLLFAGLLLIGAVSYYAFIPHDTYKNAVHDAGAAFHTGDLETVVEKSAQAASIAPSTKAALQANFLQAEGLLGRKKSGDATEAVHLLEAIVANPDGDAELKAVSYGLLAKEYIAPKPNSEVFALSASSPFHEVVANYPNDHVQAAIALLERANSMYETAYADYKLAGLQSRVLLRSKFDPKDAEQQKVATAIRAHIDAGDVLLEKLGPSSMSDIHLFDLYSSRAFALSVASKYFAELTNSTVYAAYDKAVSVGQPGASAPTFYKEQRTKFLLNYALLLQMREPGKQDVRIRQLLVQFSSDATRLPGVGAYVLEIQNRPTSNATKKVLSQLMKISPKFGAYVKGLKLTS